MKGLNTVSVVDALTASLRSRVLDGQINAGVGLTETDVASEYEVSRPTAKTGLVGWLTTVDHKKIGMLYGGFAIMFFLIGGLEALMIRTQLMVPNNRFISAQLYNELLTMHGTTMIFLAVMPLNAAFFNTADWMRNREG